MKKLSDTSPEAAAMLVRIHRDMAPAQKLRQLGEMYAVGRFLHAAGVLHRDPQATPKDILAHWLSVNIGLKNLPALHDPEEIMSITSLRDLQDVVEAFDKMGIAYAVGGSLASSLHGIGRNTNDADITAMPFPGREKEFAELLGPEYYVSIPAIQDAMRRRACFNIIQMKTGYKIDIFICKDSGFEVEALRRRKPGRADDDPSRAVFFHTPEDIVLFKLRWFRLGNEVSEQQWYDVQNVLKVQAGRLDNAYLEHWAGEIGVADLLARAREEAAES